MPLLQSSHVQHRPLLRQVIPERPNDQDGTTYTVLLNKDVVILRAHMSTYGMKECLHGRPVDIFKPWRPKVNSTQKVGQGRARWDVQGPCRAQRAARLEWTFVCCCLQLCHRARPTSLSSFPPALGFQPAFFLPLAREIGFGLLALLGALQVPLLLRCSRRSQALVRAAASQSGRSRSSSAILRRESAMSSSCMRCSSSALCHLIVPPLLVRLVH